MVVKTIGRSQADLSGKTEFAHSFGDDMSYDLPLGIEGYYPFPVKLTWFQFSLKLKTHVQKP